jgi:hypothetical protein
MVDAGPDAAGGFGSARRDVKGIYWGRGFVCEKHLVYTIALPL